MSISSAVLIEGAGHPSDEEYDLDTQSDTSIDDMSSSEGADYADLQAQVTAALEM